MRRNSIEGSEKSMYICKTNSKINQYFGQSILFVVHFYVLIPFCLICHFSYLLFFFLCACKTSLYTSDYLCITRARLTAVLIYCKTIRYYFLVTLQLSHNVLISVTLLWPIEVRVSKGRNGQFKKEQILLANWVLWQCNYMRFCMS